MDSDGRRNIDSTFKKIITGFALFLLTQGVIGVVTAVQVAEGVKQNTKDVDRNTTILNADSRSIIRVETKIQRLGKDIKEIKDDAKETRKLLREVLREVKR